MKNNSKYFNIYIFLSTLSRQLIEVFIPLILYKFGYSLKEVIIYFFLVNLFSVILSYPIVYLSTKITNKSLALIGIISFIATQILLSNMIYNMFFIVILAFAYALYRRGYWISRRYYSLVVIPSKEVATKYAIISIINQLAIIVSTYIGSLFLEFISINMLTIISISLFLLSLFPLMKIEYKYEKKSNKILLIDTIKRIPKQNLYLIGSYELLIVMKFLFTLYIFIYIKNTYQTVGILNFISNLATMIFCYFYGKKINGEKDYLRLSIFLVGLIFIIKANVINGIYLAIISFLEGLFTKMHEISISKCYFKLGKYFEYHNYNLVYEIIQNIFRTIVLLICLFINDLKIMIYITALLIFLGIFMNFKNECKNSN